MTARLPGVVLAGGQARRMGGGDKALRLIAGQSLLDRVIARLGAQCAPLALNANGDPARFAGLGLPVLADGVPGFVGPLAGVLAGLDWAAGQGAPAIVTAAADTPFFPDDLALRLRQAVGTGGLALAFSPDADGVPRQHPTFGLWPVTLREPLRAALQSGQRRVGQWAAAQGAVPVEWASDPFDPFFNVNTPQDLQQAERMVAR
ncbi:molybdenum cofactor guanylyltransferase MobA [Paracoccus sp. M683]|uniref:molybdenum cofactor guanylyltransferase MobA n=1 Tax=Paracoccus sp. M683 TaxID=2594268 RepID=UPI0011810F29|nr:molybdenum cofactor guanylyltransferase MobA [Paracoccus sp. M683]TRW95080.1 molybdenum cofactor guanylyltransferase MobA [Paracoccus sp. M683]